MKNDGHINNTKTRVSSHFALETQFLFFQSSKMLKNTKYSKQQQCKLQIFCVPKCIPKNGAKR